MTSILSYSSKGWLNHQITLMASCRDEERLANYWDAGWKQINWRYHLQSPKSHHFSNQQIKTNRNRSKSKKCLKCDSLPTPPTSVFVGFPACGVGADADPDQHCGIDVDLVAAVGPAQCGIRRSTVMSGISWGFCGNFDGIHHAK